VSLLKRKNRTTYYYGWAIVVALAITATVGYGILYYAFSVFLTAMETDLGWTRGQLTGGFSLMLLVGGAFAYPIGAWVDRHGARLLMTVGSIGACLLVMSWSQVNTLTAYYLLWTGMGICGAAVLYEPAFAVLAVWFNRRRGTALAIVTFVGGLASTIFIPLSDALLGAYGWRQAVLILGIIYGVITIPLHAFVIRRGPITEAQQQIESRDDSGTLIDRQGVSLTDALRGRFFWLVTLAFGLSQLSTAAIRVHFIPFLTDAGISATRAAAVSGSIGLWQVAGRVLYAPLDNRLSGTALAGSLFAIHAVSISALLMGPSALFIGAFVILFGMSVGARTLVRPSIVADTYGITHYGRISSVMTVFLTLSGTVAPVGAGVIYDRFGSYTPVLWIILVLAAISVGVIFFAAPTDRKSSPPFRN
jgi:MFS family permease